MRAIKICLRLAVALAVGMASFSTIVSVCGMEIGDMTEGLVQPLLQFGSKLMLEVDREKKNVIFSPLSIHSALNMLLLGAKEGSTTEKELLAALGYGKEKQDMSKHEAYAKLIDKIKETLKVESPVKKGDRQTKMDVWNMAIENEAYGKPQSSYLDAIKKYYRSDMKSVTPSESAKIDKLVKEINVWAKEAGFAHDIIGPNDFKADFSLILMSAVRVEAFWLDSFSEYTTENIFYNHGLSTKLVKNGTVLSNGHFWGQFFEFNDDIVSGKNKNPLYQDAKSESNYKKLAALNFSAIQVPLKDDVKFSVFLPNKRGTGKELKELEDALLKADGSALTEALQYLDKSHAMINFMRMPKFQFENDIELKKPLHLMGIKSIFSGEQSELTKISDRNLYVCDSRHKAMIEVDEAGLKAVGVTFLRAIPASLIIEEYPIRLEIDQPFMFIIRYGRIPMFIGHVVEV